MSVKRDEPSPRLRRAIEIVRRQLDCSESDALAHMTARVQRTNIGLEDLAPLIIERIVRFDASKERR